MKTKVVVALKIPVMVDIDVARIGDDDYIKEVRWKSKVRAHEKWRNWGSIDDFLIHDCELGGLIEKKTKSETL